MVAATNRPDVLDPALLRPGRFDRQVVVPNPDIMGREAILKVHIKKISVAPDVDIRTIARGTPGFSGADLANIVNESALRAARKNKKIVTMVDFEEASTKSTIVTIFLFFLAASKADSFTMLARSAPENPGVPLAIVLVSTSGATDIFFI